MGGYKVSEDCQDFEAFEAFKAFKAFKAVEQNSRQSKALDCELASWETSKHVS